MTWEPDEKVFWDFRDIAEGPNEDKSQMGFCELKGVTLQHNEVFWGPYEATRYQMMKDPLRAQWGYLRAPWGHLQAKLGHLGAVLDSLRSFMGHLWAEHGTGRPNMVTIPSFRAPIWLHSLNEGKLAPLGSPLLHFYNVCSIGNWFC